MSFFEYIDQYKAQLLARTLEHIGLVGLSMALAALIGIPAGIWMTRRPLVERWVLGIANMAQTIPSLALFGLLIPLPLIGGIGPRSAVVALVREAAQRLRTELFTMDKTNAGTARKVKQDELVRRVLCCAAVLLCCCA